MEQVKDKVQTTFEKVPHSKLVQLSEQYGLSISKMLEILCDFFIEQKPEVKARIES